MKKEKILVVDDNKDHRTAIEFLLRNENYDILTAPNGETGLELLNNHDDIKVLIADLAMLELSGIELLEKVKDRQQPLRRIVLTAHNEELPFEKAEELKVFSYLNKPVSKHTLLFTVKSAFKDLYPERFGETQYQWDVFISYSKMDKPLVEKITADLKRNRITYWLDNEQLEPGDHISQTIVKGLEGSRYVLCCFSRNQLKSGWCHTEYEAVLNKVISRTTGQRILPLILDDLRDEEMPLLVSSYKYERYSDSIGYQKILKRIKKPFTLR